MAAALLEQHHSIHSSFLAAVTTLFVCVVDSLSQESCYIILNNYDCRREISCPGGGGSMASSKLSGWLWLMLCMQMRAQLQEANERSKKKIG